MAGRDLEQRGRAARAAAGGLALLLALLACDVGEPARPARHLVLVSADTWRGDHALAERGGVELTPRLEAFARGAVRFSQASSVAPETSPGVAGILTGLWPRRSGVIVNVHVLPESPATLASVLAAAGFETAAVVANPVVGPGHGFERGFARYELIEALPPQRHAAADAVTSRAIELLDETPADARLFFWVHYMEPHGPYQPPEADRARLDAAAFEAPRQIPLLPEGDHSGRGGIPYYQWSPSESPSRDGRDYLARYAAEVVFLDRELGRLLDALSARGILEEAVVVVTSDHGEALAGDHGYFFSHGHALTEDQLHVPLILACPGCAPRVVPRPVSTVDIAATAFDLLGVAAPPELDGVHLLGEQAPSVIAQTRRESSIRSGPWKLRLGRGSAGVVGLVDLTRDPAERSDLAPRHPARVQALRAELLRRVRRPPLARPASRAVPSLREREALRALGYLREDPEPD